MRYSCIVIFLLLLAGCASIEDVTAMHPYTNSLIGEHVTDRTLFLYGDNQKGYSIHKKEIASSERTYTTQIVLPPRAKIMIEKVVFKSTKTAGPHTLLVGQAKPNAESASIPIATIHELLRIDILQWQEENTFKNTFRFIPSTDEYLKTVSSKTLPWESD